MHALYGLDVCTVSCDVLLKAGTLLADHEVAGHQGPHNGDADCKPDALSAVAPKGNKGGCRGLPAPEEGEPLTATDSCQCKHIVSNALRAGCLGASLCGSRTCRLAEQNEPTECACCVQSASRTVLALLPIVHVVRCACCVYMCLV